MEGKPEKNSENQDNADRLYRFSSEQDEARHKEWMEIMLEAFAQINFKNLQEERESIVLGKQDPLLEQVIKGEISDEEFRKLSQEKGRQMALQAIQDSFKKRGLNYRGPTS